MVDITQMTIKAYKKQVRNDNRTGLAPPETLAETNFEIKGHFLGMLKDISISGKDQEDAFRHIDELKDIANYFNASNVL